MSFEFHLLSLMLMFLLLVVYYNKKDSFIKGNKIYKGILLNTYIMQLVSGGVYILYSNNSNGGIFSKLYLLLILIWYVLYGLYYMFNYFKSNKIRNVKNIVNIYGIVSLICCLIVFISPITFINGYLDYGNNIITYLIFIYLMVEVLMLYLSYKRLKRDKRSNLLVIFIAQLLSYILQILSPEIPYVAVGMIIVVYYNYFMLENSDVTEIKNITLERDYAKRQSIDKSDFLRVLSHEIRTPLNAIDGFSQVIADSDDIDEIKKDVKDIRLASRDLIDVINGMIDLSILESGNLIILNENYNVYDMLDDIKNIVEAKMRDKNVKFNINVDDDIPEILSGDSERISQVVLNLVTNAIKFTDKGSITLSVDSVKSATKCRLKIVVSDTGRGIKKEDLNNIFEGKTTKTGGTLGLSVSKYLLELMGGSIEVESTYGTGSKFIITLDQKIVNGNKEENISRKRILKPIDASGKRILLVDDNKMNLKVALKLLSPYNLEVVEVNSGKGVLSILEKDKDFDLILMDDLMPEMSGTECLDILKKIERVDGFYIPVVVLTANAVAGMKEKYLSVGFDDYLAKPIDKYELDRILKKYLKDKKK